MDSIYISSIALHVRQRFENTIDHIAVNTKRGKFEWGIDVRVAPGEEHRKAFDPAIELSPQDRLSISMQYHSRWIGMGRQTLRINMKQNEVLKEAPDDGYGNRTYMKVHKHIMVSMNISALDVSPTTGSSHEGPFLPSTSEILHICPRFRLLIIGNSGVGKSTLIQKVFGVKDVNVSEDSRGQADINREFIAADNGLFVLHDSIGLEAGESNTLEQVKHFIDGRRRQVHVKDRLHAVWVCLAVPYAKGRLLEAGVEEFLQERRKILGNIPVVVVLTKVDLLDVMLFQTLRHEGVRFTSIEDAQPALQPHKERFLEQYCTQPLVRAAKGDIPRVAVSSRSGFRLESTISELVRTTTSEIERFIKADPAYAAAAAAEQPSIEHNAPLYIAGMAQRASVQTKVDLTIALGKKRYWKNLGASLTFSNAKVKEYLLVIHKDIIQVWNFNDPDMALQSDSFKEALLETVNLGVKDIRDGSAALGPLEPLVVALGPLITDAIGIAIAIPVLAGVLLAKLISEIYQSSQSIVKRFMAYIADLIYVMKILFVLAPQGSITARDVGVALEVYNRSAYRNRVHLEINAFGTDLVMLPGGRDQVVEKIEVLIGRYSITDEEVSRVRARVREAQGSGEVC